MKQYLQSLATHAHDSFSESKSENESPNRSNNAGAPMDDEKMFLMYKKEMIKNQIKLQNVAEPYT